MVDRRSLSRGAPAALLAVVLCPMAAGCHRPPVSEPPAPAAAATVLRVSPANLLTGDLARLEPHLGLTATGCVRLDAPGSEMFVGFEPDVWQAGHLVHSPGSSLSRVREPSEASLSLREVTDSHGRRKYRLVTAVSGASDKAAHTYDIDIPEHTGGTTMSSSKNLTGPRELPEGEALPVWVFVVHDDWRQDYPLEEAARSGRWALVVKLRWERIGVR